MTINTVLQADVFRYLVIYAVAATLLFLAVFVYLTRGKVVSDPIGRALILTDIFVLAQTLPLLVASFWALHGTVNTIAGWGFIGFQGLIGFAYAWLSVVFIREERRTPTKGKK